MYDNSHFSAHTAPIFKHLKLKLLRLEDISKIQIMNLYHNYVNNSLPSYFLDNIEILAKGEHCFPLMYLLKIFPENFRILRDDEIPDHRCNFTEKRPSIMICNALNNLPRCITERVLTSSIYQMKTFSEYYYLSTDLWPDLFTYKEHCLVRHCFSYRRVANLNN